MTEVTLNKLATAYYRKALSAYLHQSLGSQTAVRVKLRTGETLACRVRWWALGAFGLELEEGGRPLIVVQRHAVLDWEGVGLAPGDE